MTQNLLTNLDVLVAGAAIAWAIFSLASLMSPKRRRIHLVILFSWGLLPPLWFAFEYYAFIGIHESAREAELANDEGHRTVEAKEQLRLYSIQRQRLKDGQDLAAKCWAAIGTLVVALYFKPPAEG